MTHHFLRRTKCSKLIKERSSSLPKNDAYSKPRFIKYESFLCLALAFDLQSFPTQAEGEDFLIKFKQRVLKRAWTPRQGPSNTKAALYGYALFFFFYLQALGPSAAGGVTSGQSLWLGFNERQQVKFRFVRSLSAVCFDRSISCQRFRPIFSFGIEVFKSKALQNGPKKKKGGKKRTVLLLPPYFSLRLWIIGFFNR